MKDAYYFSHDSNAKDDPKCVLLIEQLGLEGYGIYWVLIETLREQPNYKYPLILIPALSRRYNTTFEKMKAVIMSYNLFKIENDEFFLSESLINRMQALEMKRKKRSEAGKLGNKARWEKQNELPLYQEDIANVSQCDRNASLVNESKVNNIYINWREDFEVYKDKLRDEYKLILNNKEWIEQQERYYQNIDIPLSLEKCCINYWATEAGWKKKKSSRTEEIDWKHTFANALSFKQNQVWKK